MGYPCKGCEFSLELCRLRTETDPAAPNDFRDCLDLLISHRRFKHIDHRCAPEPALGPPQQLRSRWAPGPDLMNGPCSVERILSLKQESRRFQLPNLYPSLRQHLQKVQLHDSPEG